MYQVFNTITNTPEAVLSETPYELAGPLAERKVEQKRDEQGNLLWLSATEIMDDDGNPTGEFAETTETGYYIEVVDGYDGERQPIGYHQEFVPYTPVMLDAGAIYEWREVVPTLKEIQNKKWTEIKMEREEEQYKPLTYNNLVFDFDKKSQDALAGAISAAQASLLLSIPFPQIEWTLADNSKTIVTVNDLIAILFAGIQRTNAVFAYARLLREDIFSENATKESVESIVWNYGG